MNQIIGDNILIGADNIYEMLTYVDASYTTFYDMRGHTGGCKTFCWGLIYEK